MKKTYFLLLLPLWLIAQPDFTVVYHPLINEAELATCDSNYQAALSLYDEAFKQVSDKGFAVDYYNASVCAYLSKEPQRSYNYLLHLAGKAYSIDSLKKHYFAKMLTKKDPDWVAFEAKYRQTKALIDLPLQNKFKKHLNVNLNVSFKYPKHAEQYQQRMEALLKIYHYESNIPKDSLPTEPPKYEATRDSIHKLYANYYHGFFTKALSLIDSLGFPDEDLVGENLAFGDSFHFYSFLKWKRLHHRSEETENQHFSGLIKQAVRDGKLHPREARNLLLYEEDGNLYQYGNMRIFQVKLDGDFECDETLTKQLGKWLWKPEVKTEEELRKIDLTRKQIGLEPLDDFYTKSFYFNAESAHWFIGYKTTFKEEITYAASCESLRELLQQAEEL